MAGQGHIQLGSVSSGTLTPFNLTDPSRGRRRVLANPLATKISSGGAQFDDQEPFHFWVQGDWSAGLKQRGEDQLGPWWSTAETRFTSLLFPGGLSYAWRGSVHLLDGTEWPERTEMFDGEATNLYVLPGNTWERQQSAPAFNTHPMTWVLLSSELGVDTILAPGSGLTASPGGAWVRLDNFTGDNITSDINAIGYTTDHSHIATAFANRLSAAKQWVMWKKIGSEPLEMCLVTQGVGASDSHRFEAQDIPANPTNLTEVARGTLSKPYAATLFKNQVIDIGQNGSTQNPAVPWIDPPGRTTRPIQALEHRGILWVLGRDLGTPDQVGKLYGNDNLADATPQYDIETPPFPNEVLFIAGEPWLACSDGLYHAPAMTPPVYWLGVVKFPLESDRNGVGMAVWNNTIYIPVEGNKVLALSLDTNTLTTIGLNQSGAPPYGYSPRPGRLFAGSSFLFMATDAQSETEHPAVYAYDGRGWHFIAPLLQGCIVNGPITEAHGTLWVPQYDPKAHSSTIMRVPVRGRRGHPFYAITNADVDYGVAVERCYNPASWMETAWIEGGLVDTLKNFFSVWGQFEGGAGHVDVFYQLVDGGAWVPYGRIDRNNPEAEPPADVVARRVRFGFRIYDDPDGSLEYIGLDALRVKQTIYVSDRWRWTLSIRISAESEDIDYTPLGRTIPEELLEIESLIRHYGKLTFIDVDGRNYEVHLTASDDIVEDYRFIPGTGGAEMGWVFNITLEELTPSV